MTNEPKNPTTGRSPVSVRLTLEERLRLEQAANGMSLSKYIRFRLFQADTAANAGDTEIRLSPAARQRLLAQILATLGKSGIAATLSELTELARLGLFPSDADTATPLAQARDELIKLRRDLLRGLGLRPKSGGKK